MLLYLQHLLMHLQYVIFVTLTNTFLLRWFSIVLMNKGLDVNVLWRTTTLQCCFSAGCTTIISYIYKWMSLSGCWNKVKNKSDTILGRRHQVEDIRKTRTCSKDWKNKILVTIFISVILFFVRVMLPQWYPYNYM